MRILVRNTYTTGTMFINIVFSLCKLYCYKVIHSFLFGLMVEKYCEGVHLALIINRTLLVPSVR